MATLQGRCPSGDPDLQTEEAQARIGLWVLKNAKALLRAGDTNVLMALLYEQSVDFTACFRALSSVLRGDAEPVRSLFSGPSAFDAWAEGWRMRLSSSEPSDPQAIAAAMDRVNPIYIPRNHLVEEALTAATAGDLEPFERLNVALARPFEERPALERYATPAPQSFTGEYQTFCGT